MWGVFAIGTPVHKHVVFPTVTMEVAIGHNLSLGEQPVWQMKLGVSLTKNKYLLILSILKVRVYFLTILYQYSDVIFTVSPCCECAKCREKNPVVVCGSFGSDHGLPVSSGSFPPPHRQGSAWAQPATTCIWFSFHLVIFWLFMLKYYCLHLDFFAILLLCAFNIIFFLILLHRVHLFLFQF